MATIATTDTTVTSEFIQLRIYSPLSLVTGQSAQGSGTTTGTATLPNTPVQGNIIVASTASLIILASGVPTIADGNSNAMTQLASKVRTAAAQGIAVYGWIAGASQSKSFTATGFTGDTVYLNVYEFSGNIAATNGTASTFLDNSQTGTSSGSGSTTTVAISPTLTTTNANDMIFSTLNLNTVPTTTLTANNNTTILQGNPANPGAFLADANLMLTNTVSAQDYGWSWNASKAYAHIAVALLSSVPFFVGVNDSTTTSESVSLTLVNNTSVSDSTTTSESIGLQIVSFVNVSDSTVTSELITMDGVVVSDSTTTSESITVRSDENPNVSDTTTTSESITVALAQQITVSDTATTSESITASLLSFINVLDSTVTAESINITITGGGNAYTINVSDSTTTSENISLVITPYFINVSDTTLITERVNDTETKFISVHDNTTITESRVVSPPFFPLIVSDTTVTSESITILPYVTPTNTNIRVAQTGMITVSVARVTNPNFKIHTGAL